MVKMGGSPGAAETRAHIEYARRLGFNALWVHGYRAGRWDPVAAPGGPFLDPAFLQVSRWCRENGMRIFVSIHPVSAARPGFAFHDRKGERRIVKFMRMLRRKAGVRDFVLSLDDTPARTVDLNDFLRYGKSSAPAHLDLAARIFRRMRKGDRFWLTAAAYCDAHLGDGTTPYAAALLAGLPGLPPEIGMVWTGPSVLSPAVTGEQIRRARERLGGRRILLYDNYPVNDDGRRLSMGLVLGPLRNRSADLADEVAVYLTNPMAQLGANRLPLRTIASYLRDPEGYDADAAWQEAIRELSGGDARALEALRTQAMEWGGWIGGRNYHHVDRSSIFTAARELSQPAAVALWSYTRKRYPERIASLQNLPDTPFRHDLLLAMNRRLAVARAIPLVLEYRARIAAGRGDSDQVLEAIRKLAGSIAERPVRLVLESFLEAAEVPSAGIDPE